MPHRFGAVVRAMPHYCCSQSEARQEPKENGGPGQRRGEFESSVCWRSCRIRHQEGMDQSDLSMKYGKLSRFDILVHIFAWILSVFFSSCKIG